MTRCDAATWIHAFRACFRCKRARRTTFFAFVLTGHMYHILWGVLTGKWCFQRSGQDVFRTCHVQVRALHSWKHRRECMEAMYPVVCCFWCAYHLRANIPGRLWGEAPKGWIHGYYGFWLSHLDRVEQVWGILRGAPHCYVWGARSFVHQFIW